LKRFVLHGWLAITHLIVNEHNVVYTKVMFRARQGFTIIELLIVIVVIAILAAISIVAYRGIQERSRVSAIGASLTQAAKKLSLWQVDNSDQYPADLTSAGIMQPTNIDYQYTYNNAVNPATYCLTATYGSLIYRISSQNKQPLSGACSGYNLLAWNKQDAATVAIPSAAIDTSVFRSSTASMRLGPNMSGVLVRNSPYDVTEGQVYTLRFWLRTDSNWNGQVNNSKIRFGNMSSANELLESCSYHGIKTVWSEVYCSYTVAAGITQLSISVGNDGTVGNIWIDDFSLSRS
jgi:prepilin-type N-terminal cleavage/methylation domain-containing protein